VRGIRVIVKSLMSDLASFGWRGRVAQWIEYQVPVLRAAGSNPATLVIFKRLGSPWISKAFDLGGDCRHGVEILLIDHANLAVDWARMPTPIVILRVSPTNDDADRRKTMFRSGEGRGAVVQLGQ
jgi:hypothetical protein